MEGDGEEAAEEVNVEAPPPEDEKLIAQANGRLTLTTCSYISIFTVTRLLLLSQSAFDFLLNCLLVRSCLHISSLKLVNGCISKTQFATTCFVIIYQ